MCVCVCDFCAPVCVAACCLLLASSLRKLESKTHAHTVLLLSVQAADVGDVLLAHQLWAALQASGQPPSRRFMHAFLM